MKRSLALALAAFLGLGLLSTSFAGFAQDAYGGVTSWRAPTVRPAATKPIPANARRSQQAGRGVPYSAV
jgi:hypothetical protein